VAGAQVVFSTPNSGASGEFANDSRAITVTSDADGFASAGAYHPNGLTGSYDIRIRVTYQGRTGATVVPQVNVTSTGHLKLIAIIVIIAAVAGAAIAARHHGNSPTAPTITLGGTAVGAP
jgi:hypothetical protein